MSENKPVWWFVNVVQKSTGKVVEENVDGILAPTVSQATELAAARNPLRPGCQFGLRMASALQARKCRAVNTERTSEIYEFKKLMTD